MKNILVLLPVNEYHKQIFNDSLSDGAFCYSSANEATPEQINNAHVIVGNPPPDLLKEAKHLELLQLESAGTDAYIKENVVPKGAALTNATGAYGLAISEHILAMIFMVYKKLPQYLESQKMEKWADFGQVRSIYGKKALILGAGDIGGNLAKKLKALGVYTIGVRRTVQNKPVYFDELYLTEKLDELLPRADIVAMSLPGTKETYHIMDEKRLRSMKKDSLIVNVGRGNAIDTDALCQVLKEGRLLGACLDVTEPEPLPKNHPLWHLEGVYITPHVSGGHHLNETLDEIVKISAQNIRRFYTGVPLQNIVDYETGYSKI